MQILKNLPKNKVIAAISPHPDDSAISCGALLGKLSRQNKVYTIIMSSGYRGSIKGGEDKGRKKEIRNKEAMEEARILGTIPLFPKLQFYETKEVTGKDVNTLRALFKKIKPRILILPCGKDSHPTHQQSREIAIRAANGLKAMFIEFEGPWGMFSKGEFNTVFAFDEKLLGLKVKAIGAHRSQVERVRYDLFAGKMAEMRGILLPELTTEFGGISKKGRSYVELYNKL